MYPSPPFYHIYTLTVGLVVLTKKQRGAILSKEYTIRELRKRMKECLDIVDTGGSIVINRGGKMYTISKVEEKGLFKGGVVGGHVGTSLDKQTGTDREKLRVFDESFNTESERFQLLKAEQGRMTEWRREVGAKVFEGGEGWEERRARKYGGISIPW